MLLRQTHKTLYTRVAEKLRRRLKTLSPGTVLDSESTLARQFGVSVATVREAIRLLAAEGRLQSRQGKGTVVLAPAPKAVGLLLDLDVLDPKTSRFYFEAALAARHALEAAGEPVRHYYGRATAEQPNDPCRCEEFFEDLRAGKLSGVIALATFPEPGLLEAIRKASIPAVGMYPGFPSSVCLDAEQFLREGIGYCVARGRRRIAMLAWNSVMAPEFCNFAQFSKAMEDHGLTAHPEWHCADLHPNLTGVGWESFREIWSARREKPDAILICDDCLFPDAFRAIANLNLELPGDLLIVTETREGNEAVAGLPVARLEISARHAGEALAQTLDEAAKATPVRRSLPFHLIPLAASAVRTTSSR